MKVTTTVSHRRAIPDHGFLAYAVDAAKDACSVKHQLQRALRWRGRTFELLDASRQIPMALRGQYRSRPKVVLHPTVKRACILRVLQ
jgi:hypothetical protein